MVIDSLAFARAWQRLSGTLEVLACARLCEGLPPSQSGAFAWSLEGRTQGAESGAWLDVQASGTVQAVCQRCLQPFALALRVDRSLGLAETQAQLDALDALEAQGDGADAEYVLASRQLRVLELIEDELILAMPYAPRHAQCPGSVAAPGTAAPSERSPFAALAQLKKSLGKH